MQTRKSFYSTGELAEKLGVSRVTVFNKIKNKDLPAKKVGRNYIIAAADVDAFLANELTEKTKQDIAKSVKMVVDQYGDALVQLGKE